MICKISYFQLKAQLTNKIGKRKLRMVEDDKDSNYSSLISTITRNSTLDFNQL